MATIKEFEEAAEKLTFKQLLKVKHSLSTLLSWEFFEKEYRRTGIKTIKNIVSEEIISKAKADKRKLLAKVNSDPSIGELAQELENTPINLNQAKNLAIGETIYHIRNKNADGSMQRWRVNGKVKTWKRSPEKVNVPLKHGLYSFGYLNEFNLGEFTLHEKP